MSTWSTGRTYVRRAPLKANDDRKVVACTVFHRRPNALGGSPAVCSHLAGQCVKTMGVWIPDPPLLTIPGWLVVPRTLLECLVGVHRHRVW